MLVLVFHNTCFYTINIMKVFETVDMFANPFFCLCTVTRRFSPLSAFTAQGAAGDWRIQEGSERQRERGSAGRGGVLGQALAQSSSFFLCAADKQNKMRARRNFRGRHLCFHIRVRGPQHVSLSLCVCVCVCV